MITVYYTARYTGSMLVETLTDMDAREIAVEGAAGRECFVVAYASSSFHLLASRAGWRCLCPNDTARGPMMLTCVMPDADADADAPVGMTR